MCRRAGKPSLVVRSSWGPCQLAPVLEDDWALLELVEAAVKPLPRLSAEAVVAEAEPSVPVLAAALAVVAALAVDAVLEVAV